MTTSSMNLINTLPGISNVVERARGESVLVRVLKRQNSCFAQY